LCDQKKANYYDDLGNKLFFFTLTAIFLNLYIDPIWCVRYYILCFWGGSLD